VRVTAYFDASVKQPNPGDAGAGVVLYGPDGAELCAFSSYLGVRTVNEAEYAAAILAVEEALSRGATHLELYGDSQVVIFQTTGVYDCHAPNLKPYLAALKDALSDLPSWNATHVRRKLNGRADYLSRLELNDYLSL
jgi:ribonuclease HI